MSTEATATVPAPAVPSDAARPSRWRRRRTSLSAHGEPMVWLTGGALVSALAMIVGLLGWIFYEGVTTFWPAPVVLYKTIDGGAVLGEVARTETFHPEDSTFEQYEPKVAALAKAKVEAAGGDAVRRLIRTGNFELKNTHFDLLPDFLIASQESPPWALVIERMTWGRFYGWPNAFILDGKAVTDTPEETWTKFQEYHASVRSRAAKRDKLEEQIGRINSQLSDEQLHVQAVELHSASDSPEATAARRRLAAAQADADGRISALRSEIRSLDKENARY
ncbi:MAG TPA: hypothetical protein VHB99_11345, partial [Pirellulales bacterium]|nr:hypothetical protein [Pirellulales bacterium]